MKRTILLWVILTYVSIIHAQTLPGDWYGILKVPNNEIRLIFHIVRDSNQYLATLEVPSQGSQRLLMDSSLLVGNHVRLKMLITNIYFNGTFYPDSNKINGIFNQGAFSTTISLSKKVIDRLPSEIPITRPQNPLSFPYKQEEVSFTNPKTKNIVSGTLTFPNSGVVSKLVILLAGSGPLNRDEDLGKLNQKPFLVWSDFLTRNGIGVFRYDKRGIAKSNGDYTMATTLDFASDAEAALAYILSRPDLKNLSIGLMGHSEGGILAPMVASSHPDVQFIILLAAPGVPIPELMAQQGADLAKLMNSLPAQIAIGRRINSKLYSEIISNSQTPVALLKEKLGRIYADSLLAYPHPGVSDDKIIQGAKTGIIGLTSPWYRTFLSLVPDQFLNKITCPVLALNGTLDFQVNAAINLPAIKSSLEKAGNKHFEVLSMEGYNHFFQKAKTGDMAEYSQISETVNPEVLTRVLAWINKLTRL